MVFDFVIDNVGSSPRHPPIPKKPAIASKPSNSKPPVVAPKKNGSGKTPVPKPKPRTPQKPGGSRSGSPSVPLSPSRSALSQQKSDEKNSNEVVKDSPGSVPGDLIRSSDSHIEPRLVEAKCNDEQEETLHDDVHESNGSEVEVAKLQNGYPDYCLVGEIVQCELSEDEDVKQPSSPIDIFQDVIPAQPFSNCENGTEIPPLSPIDIFKDVSKKQSAWHENNPEEIKPTTVPERKLPKKQPPPLKPRTLNPNLPPRRTKSAFVPDSHKMAETNKEVSATKSIDVLGHDDNVIHPEQRASDDMPAIPLRRKRLSREITTSPLAIIQPKMKTDGSSSPKSPATPVNSSVGSSARPPRPTARRRPLRECISNTVDEESPPGYTTPINTHKESTPVTEKESPPLQDTSKEPHPFTNVKEAPTVTVKPPPLPTGGIVKDGSKESPVTEESPIVTRKIGVTEEIFPTTTPPKVTRRTDTNGNPSTTNKIRAKSEFIKNKPGRPPPPAAKPTLSMALISNGSTPPPKHPKPTVRKAKSQCLPSDTSLGFTNIDINNYSKDSDSPKIPVRSKRKSSDKFLDPDHAKHGSSPDKFILKKTVYSSKGNPTIEPEITASDTKAECPIDSKPEPIQAVAEKPRKSSPPLPKSKESRPKLQRSMTEPASDGPPKPTRFLLKDVPTRKAPPIPIKPIHSSGSSNAFESDTDSSRSSCTSPEIPSKTPEIPSKTLPTSPKALSFKHSSSSCKTPPLSPKSFSFKSQHSVASPKHRPRMPPPPPPAVERTHSTQLPEPLKYITSRSQSLDATLTSDNCDPNGNIPRTSTTYAVENKNAKNAMKLDAYCNRDGQDSSSNSAVQSISDSTSSISRSSVVSEDDYVLPDPDPQSPPLSPRRVPNQDDLTYQNKQVASVRPSRRAPPRPVKPVLLPKVTLTPSKMPQRSPSGTCPVSPSAFSRAPGSGKLKKRVPSKPVRRSLSVNSDISNDGYEDMSKGSSLASSLGIGAQMADLYSVPRTCEHTLHESGNCSCAQQYAEVVSSGDEDGGSISDEEEERYEKFVGDKDGEEGSSTVDGKIGNTNKAYLVAKEIRDSERVFVDVLKLLNKDFRQAIDDAGTREGRAVIEQLLLHQILGHLPQLHLFNEELLEDLDETVDHWSEKPSISGIFLKKGPYLKLYSSYIRDFEKITTVFDEACGRFPLFGAAVRDFELSERCQNLAIKHYMLKPIQRIPQYKMLLTDYLKNLESGTTEHAETLAALNIVSEVANHANECMRQGDNFGKLLQIQHSLIGNHEIVKPGRVFIKEGELLKLSRKVMQPRKFYLMSDILLYTTPFPPGQYKLNNVLSLAGMRVNKPQLEDFKNELNIISVQRSFTLSASTPKERDEWIQVLTTTITDYATKRSSFSVLQPQLIEGDTSSLGRKAPIWIPDSRVTMCMICTCEFTVTWRRHHCRACGKVVCGNCSMNKVPLMYLSQKTARICEECFNVLANEECTEEEGSPGKERKFNAKSKRKRSLVMTRRPSALKEVSANESDTNMSGYLHVKRKKDWKRMWFVLKGKVLYTYKASEDVAALESMPLLGYEVKTLDEYFEGVEPGLVVQLYHQGRVMLVIRTESKAAAEKWAFAMVDATTL